MDLKKETLKTKNYFNSLSIKVFEDAIERNGVNDLIKNNTLKTPSIDGTFIVEIQTLNGLKINDLIIKISKKYVKIYKENETNIKRIDRIKFNKKPLYLILEELNIKYDFKFFTVGQSVYCVDGEPSIKRKATDFVQRVGIATSNSEITIDLPQG